MRKSRIQYILTWVSVGTLLISTAMLMALAWNGALKSDPSYILMILLWAVASGSGIYLFMLAVKKAHRLMITEERQKEQPEGTTRESRRETRSASKDRDSLDAVATARKLVRRIPPDIPMEELGDVILQNLAKELEIMSGILYLKHKDRFQAVANYALAGPDKPYEFTLGEGLSGQAAASRQIMVLTRLPEGHQQVYSGLGKAPPKYLAIVPLVKEETSVAVLECSGYRYDPGEIESMFRIFARDLMETLSTEEA